MGRIATVLSTEEAERDGVPLLEIKVDLGAGNTALAELFAPSGFDARPLPDDSAALVSSPRAGGWTAVAFLDPAAERKAQVGEQRLYARDSAGETVAEVWVRADGTVVVEATGAVELSNGSGSLTIGAGGAIDLNGVTVDTEGNIRTPGSVDANAVTGTTSVSVGVSPVAIELLTHTHLAGVPPGPTGPPLP